MKLAWALACFTLPSALAADDFALSPAVYEKLEIEQRLASDGSLEETRRATLRIQSEAGAEWAGQIPVPLRREDAEVSLLSLRVGESGGEMLERDPVQLQELPRDGSGFRAWAVPGLHSGDRAIYEVRLRYPAAGQTKWWANLAPVFDLPVIAGQWTVRLPETGGINSNLWRAAGHRETQPGVHVWQLDGSPAQLRPAPWFSVSTFNTWNEVGDWLRARQSTADAAWLREQTPAMLAGVPQADALRALYMRVSQGIHLLDEPLDSSGLSVARPRQTLAEGAGNAFSKHALLAALLATRDIPCDAAFVAGDLPLEADFPSPGQFERVISAIPKDQGWTWLDASSGVARFGALLPELRGRRALLVSSRGSRIVQIPPAPPDLNQVRAIWSGELRLDGDAHASVRLELQGDAELALRQAFADGDSPAGPLGELLAHSHQYELTSMVLSSPVYDLRGPLVVQTPLDLYEFVQPLTERTGTHFQVFNYGLDCQCSFQTQDAQRSTLLRAPLRAEEIFEMRLPPEIQPILPPPVSEKLASGSLEVSTTFDGSLLRIHRSLDERSASEADALRLATALALDSSRSQVFQRVGPIDVEAALKGKDLSTLDWEGYQAVETNAPLARAILEYATRKFPDSKYSWNNLGRVYEFYGLWQDALRAYQRQIEVNPADQWAYDNYGKVLSGAQRYQEAIPWFERQLAIDPNSYYALRDLGHVYLELGEWDQAEQNLRHALKDWPRSQELLQDLGLTQACRGDLQGAKEVFLQVLKDCPTAAVAIAWEMAGCGASPDYAMTLAQAARRLSEEAFDDTRDLPDWRAGLGAQELQAAGLMAIGRTLLSMKQPQQALETLQAAAALGMDDELLVALRDAAIALGDLKTAAQAHVDAQALTRGRTIEVPAAIAEAVKPVAPWLDAEGWTPLPLRAAAPAAGLPDRPLLVACTVSEAGVAQACTLLDTEAALQDAALREVARAAFPRVNWRGKDERTVRLVRLRRYSDGRVEALMAASPQAIRNAALLAPTAARRRDTDEE
jgi:tetratricopeptide (TPR) repeat protein